MLSEAFAFLVDKYGSPQNAKPLPEAFASAYRDLLPPSLLDFWQECGLGMWLNGKFQFCNPTEYKSIVDLILEHDPTFKPAKTHLYGYSAFGELWLWNEEYQRLEITLPRLRASAPATAIDWKAKEADRVLFSPLSRLDKFGTADLREDSDAAPLMFDSVLKSVGELALGQCYGFVPALALGGAAKVENVRRVRALEHFAILAQLGPVKLFDYSTKTQRYVRTLGEN